MFHKLKIRQQAKIDYQQARGSAHKDLLQRSKRNLQQQRAAAQRIITTARNEIKRLELEWEQNLGQALTDYLVRERLTEISGIGEARKADILRRVYKGKLTDLHRAQQLPGIGAQTQWTINQWVRYYQKNFSKLLRENFLGDQKITAAYQQSLASENQKIAAAEKTSHEIQLKLDRLEPELTRLEKVTAKDFQRALKNPDANTPNLDHYVQGVFAEWEAVPEWFRNIIAVANVNWQPEGNEQRETAVARSKPDLLTWVNNKWRVGLLFVAILVFCGCSFMFWVILPNEAEDEALPTQTATMAITLAPSPSAQPTMTSTPSPQAIVTNTAAATVAEAATETAVAQTQVQVIISAANVRAAAEAAAAVVAVVRVNDVLAVLDINENGTWYLIELPDGGEGWIGSSVVKLIGDNEESP